MVRWGPQWVRPRRMKGTERGKRGGPAPLRLFAGSLRRGLDDGSLRCGGLCAAALHAAPAPGDDGRRHLRARRKRCWDQAPACSVRMQCAGIRRWDPVRARAWKAQRRRGPTGEAALLG